MNEMFSEGTALMKCKGCNYINEMFSEGTTLLKCSVKELHE